MKQEDLKVGMVIKSSGRPERTIIAIGSINYFFSYIDCDGNLAECSVQLQHLNIWEPVEPEPELFYRWIIKDGRWYASGTYISVAGFTTGNQSFNSRWSGLEKRIRLDIAPIDKNGREHPKGSR